MTERFYRLLILASKWLGSGLFSLVAAGIAAGYFVMRPEVRRSSAAFYAVLFPEIGRRQHLLCAWRQFRHFTYVFLDRTLMDDGEGIHYSIDGAHHLETVIDSGNGGILLMSHMGNWEMAAHLLQRRLPDLRLLLYMGTRQTDEIEALQKQGLAGAGVRVVGVEEGGGSPFDIVEGIRFLKSGGLVSMAGDRIWRSGQRTVAATMFGRRVELPESPFLLASASRVPIVVFFAFRQGDRRYRLVAHEPIHVAVADRRCRDRAIKEAAQIYSDHLAAALRAHPFDWFHFQPFLSL
jgi:predicted LPLAT superfamily acyltransferase